ncbi:hypothetical protein AJ79_01116 [Helicocarpus griseus UAMH5409]|uniref:Mitochondrial adapter protein MCP1 transmembrane domain-containing protein n=1 Tax=Helicocarpus griseus UAMH5409 TaxID=1447875 RepID=A0A2B7Y7P4_9EURO|nr:hypothetical protein AJ79_01116 [Helicocarpus griseus UAMH5409]
MDEQSHAAGRQRLPSNVDPSPMSLQELDPSPVEEWTPDLEQGGYFPKTSPNGASSSPDKPNSSRHPNLGLGLSGRGWDYWLLTLQRTSTYPPTLFLTLHLTNTGLLPLVTRSLPASEPYLLLTRPIYQSPGLEHLLITLPILTHLASGVALRILRARRRARLYGAETRAQRHDLRRKGSWKLPSIQARLGYLLVPLLGAHVLVNRVVPVYVDGGSSGVGLGFVAHGFARAPWVMNLGYVAFVGVGVWHFAGGWAWWMGWRSAAEPESRVMENKGPNGGLLGSKEVGSEWRRKVRKARWVVNGVAAVGALVWLAGGLGVVGRGGLGSGWEGRGWDRIFKEMPLLGWIMGLR